MAKVSNAARLIMFCVDSPHVNVSYTNFSEPSWVGEPNDGYGQVFNPRADTARKLMDAGVLNCNSRDAFVGLTAKGQKILAEESAKGYRLALKADRKPRVVTPKRSRP